MEVCRIDPRNVQGRNHLQSAKTWAELAEVFGRSAARGEMFLLTVGNFYTGRAQRYRA
jgi:hypothetical protein